MRSFEDFVEEVKIGIKGFLPDDYADAEVKVTETQKLNDTYPALIVRKPDELITPSINLRDVYESVKDGKDMVDVFEGIAKMVQMRPEGLDIGQYSDYEKAKENLFIRVSGAEANKDVLANVPHTLVDNLAITYHLVAGMAGNSFGSTMITNKLMETLGITKEQLHEDAVANSEKIMKPEFLPMTKMIGRLMGVDADIPETKKSFDEQLKDIDVREEGMFVLTNTESLNGAAVMFYPDVLKKIGEQIGGDFFVLPSSVHETLIIPDNGDVDYHTLEATVMEVNTNEVSEKERLSNSVYHYDSVEHIFERAEVFEERTQEKEIQHETVKDKLLAEARAQVEAQFSEPKEPEKEEAIE